IRVDGSDPDQVKKKNPVFGWALNQRQIPAVANDLRSFVLHDKPAFPSNLFDSRQLTLAVCSGRPMLLKLLIRLFCVNCLQLYIIDLLSGYFHTLHYDNSRVYAANFRLFVFHAFTPFLFVIHYEKVGNSSPRDHSGAPGTLPGAPLWTYSSA